MEAPGAYYILSFEDGTSDVTQDPEEVMGALTSGARAFLVYGYEIRLEEETDESPDAAE